MSGIAPAISLSTGKRGRSATGRSWSAGVRSCYHARCGQRHIVRHAAALRSVARIVDLLRIERASDACDHVVRARRARRHVRRARRRRGTVGRGGRRTGSRERGHRVLVVEKKRFPRDKTCGDGLTPRAVRQLHDMGLAEPLCGLPALRRPALDRRTASRSSSPGPSTPTSRPYGYVVRRRELDEMVADQAVKAGATLWQARRGARAGGRGRPRRRRDGAAARTRARSRPCAPAT